MKRHAIDPLSAVLGLAAAAAGVFVAVGRADSFTDDAVWWIALLALLLGVALVPWNRRSYGSDGSYGSDSAVTSAALVSADEPMSAALRSMESGSGHQVGDDVEPELGRQAE